MTLRSGAFAFVRSSAFARGGSRQLLEPVRWQFSWAFSGGDNYSRSVWCYALGSYLDLWPDALSEGDIVATASGSPLGEGPLNVLVDLPDGAGSGQSEPASRYARTYPTPVTLFPEYLHSPSGGTGDVGAGPDRFVLSNGATVMAATDVIAEGWTLSHTVLGTPPNITLERWIYTRP